MSAPIPNSKVGRVILVVLLIGMLGVILASALWLPRVGVDEKRDRVHMVEECVELLEECVRDLELRAAREDAIEHGEAQP